MERKNVWLKYNEEQMKGVEEFSVGYKQFLSEGKTERECVMLAIDIAEQNGYQNLDELLSEGKTLKTGDKVYASYMDKTIALFHIGKRSFDEGLRILGAHIDSPRLDLKQNPLYEDSDFAYLDTHYYGGIKKYQWVTIPLALHGVVAKKDGSIIEVVIGEDEDDPVLGITDLLIHLAADQMTKKGSIVIEGEDLNVLVGSKPLKNEDDKKQKDAVKQQILKFLQDTCEFEEEDFLSAEFEVVPAGKARDFGLDRSMIMSYGHDDRVCAYPSLMALMQINEPEYTSVCILVDKEEIGSVGATGMHSRFFENILAEVMNAAGDYTELKLRRTLANSRMLSSDVNAGYDPIYASAFEKNNASYLGRGVVFSKYTGARGKSGSNDANAEYIAKLRKMLDEADVSFQMAELGKVDVGGGGTIAYIMANYGMDVIDSGVAVLNMHAPWEIISKADLYEAFRCYQVFLCN